MREPYHEEAGHEPWPSVLDLPSTPRSQRREGEGLAVAVSYIYLGQRLELDVAIGGLIWGSFRAIASIPAEQHHLRQFTLHLRSTLCSL